MRRERYRKILILLAILIVLAGIWGLCQMKDSTQIIEGTFVYAD